MIDQTGARRQESLRTTPAMDTVQSIYATKRGVITTVKYKDGAEASRMTVVDIFLSGFPPLQNVPIATTKSNDMNGEEWTPDPGDGVLVTFVDGNFWEPVIIGFLPMVDNEIQAATTDAPAGKRRYHRRCNKTDLVIDKDGNRIEHVEGNETITIKGHETVTVETGDITVDVVAGKCTVHVKGKTVWKSDGTIDMDGGSSDMSGVVTKTCICSFTGLPHMDYSGNVRASKG